MSKKLTEQDYIEVAKSINCEVKTIKAVKQIESSGNGFDEQGRLLLRFEGHVFRGLTNKKYDKSNPNISYPYYLMRQKKHGYEAFNEAFALDKENAMLSCSFGLFQIMGFNHRLCGFDTVGEMVDYYKLGEYQQLSNFATFCKNRGLVDELQTRNWARFAFQYNGADYKANNYDVKLRRAYERA